MRPPLLLLLIAALLALAPAPAAAEAATPDRTAKKLDVFWTSPDLPGVALRSIAMLPAATYTNDLATEKEVEIGWGQAFRATGYRWYSSTLAKDLLKRAFGGDSVLTATRAQLLKAPRVDSTSAIALCGALHMSAVLSIRVDLWEKTEMEWNQTGKPWTTVQLKAALVDSAGRLLWTASGSQTLEGPLHSADNNTVGVKSSGLNLQPVTAQAGAPSFQEVLALLLGRWVERFPERAGGAPAAGPGGGP